MNQLNENAAPALLDQEKFRAISGAFARLQALGDKTIDAGPSDNTHAEREQLIQYLATEMLRHCGEFIAAWSICNNEFLPMCNAMRKVAVRCGFFTPPPFKKEIPNGKE